MSEGDPDGVLVRRIGRGDTAAVALLVRAKLPRLLGLATRMLRDRFEAEDVTQEAFLRAWRQARLWQPGGARFDTWLHTVVLNLCRDRLRSRREVSDMMPLWLPDPAPDAETALLDGEQGQAVATAISQLPERQREAILLVHYQELPGIEAASALGITVEALESLLARGRRTLQAQFTTKQGSNADV